MFELGAKLVLAGAILFLAGVFRALDFDLAWKLSAAIAATAVFSWRIEVKGLKNPGVAGFFAIADCYTIALLLSCTDQLANLGFIVLAPCILATVRFRTPATYMAPLAASSLLVGHSILHAGQLPSNLLMLQAMAVMVVCLLVRTPEPMIEIKPASEAVDESEIILDRDDYLELRENFRKLRDAYRDLEYKSRRGRLIAALEEARVGQGAKLFSRLAEKVQEVCGAEFVTLYAVAKFADQFVVKGASAGAPQDLSEFSIPVALDLAPGQIRHRVEQAVASIRTEAGASRTANVLLIESGRVVGLVSMGHGESGRLAEAREKCEELAPYLAGLLEEELRLESEQRRMREAELLYEVASISMGATTAASIAARVARDLKDSVNADHVGIYLLEGGHTIALACQGPSVRLHESLTIGARIGVEGWLESGAPDIIACDARNSDEIDPTEATKKRVGSYVLIPLRDADDTIGFIACSTHRRGGLDRPHAVTLRLAAIEVARAITRLEKGVSSGAGVMTPAEFANAVSQNTGSFVYLEPLRKDGLAESFGRSAVEAALRRLAAKLVKTLPASGCLCRRDEGDYVAFLPGATLEDASRWANEAASVAALVPVESLDRTIGSPLAIRSKVAEMNRQEHEVFDPISA